MHCHSAEVLHSWVFVLEWGVGQLVVLGDWEDAFISTPKNFCDSREVTPPSFPLTPACTDASPLSLHPKTPVAQIWVLQTTMDFLAPHSGASMPTHLALPTSADATWCPHGTCTGVAGPVCHLGLCPPGTSWDPFVSPRHWLVSVRDLVVFQV